MYTQLINVREARRSYQYWVNTTQGEGKIQHRKLKRLATRTPPKKEGVNSGDGEGKIVPASYKTPTVLLIYLSVTFT